MTITPMSQPIHTRTRNKRNLNQREENVSKSLTHAQTIAAATAGLKACRITGTNQDVTSVKSAGP